jgi:hypothetical protein
MTDAGREQVNAGMQVSPQYILRSDITAQDVTNIRLKDIGILTNVKVN